MIFTALYSSALPSGLPQEYELFGEQEKPHIAQLSQ